MTRFVTALAVLLCVGSAGCGASRRYFTPSERVEGRTASGSRQALYRLTGPLGEFGEAQIWSNGAYESREGANVVHIGVLLHDTSGKGMQLDPRELRLDVARKDDLLPELAPAETKPLTIGPGELVEQGLHFLLPSGVSPSDVHAFRLRWQVLHEGFVYRQRTPFVQEVKRYYRPYYYGGYYGPGFYGGAGFYWGAGCWPYGFYDCAFGHPVVVPQYHPIPDPNIRQRVVPPPEPVRR